MTSRPSTTSATSPAGDVLTGSGRTHCHHGEILQGAFEVDGEIRRGLVTLPCTLFETEVSALLLYGDGSLAVDPPWRRKALAAATLALAELDMADLGVRLSVASSIPICRGFGSSTADVVASILAVIDAAGEDVPAATVAEWAVRAETASDPIMFDDAPLFAQRDGIVIEELSGRLFPIEVLGFTTSDCDGVDTLSFPPAQYSTWETQAFRPLLGLLRRALARRSAADLGSVATACARLNQRHLPVPRFDELEATAEEVGAAGLQVAHTGTIAGFIFAVDDPALEHRIERARRRLSALGVSQTWRFTAGKGVS